MTTLQGQKHAATHIPLSLAPCTLTHCKHSVGTFRMGDSKTSVYDAASRTRCKHLVASVTSSSDMTSMDYKSFAVRLVFSNKCAVVVQYWRCYVLVLHQLLMAQSQSLHLLSASLCENAFWRTVRTCLRERVHSSCGQESEIQTQTAQTETETGIRTLAREV